jgi:hypothetical protein
MCAVCWTGAQIIPVSAAAGRYIWVNHLRYRRGPDGDPEPEVEAEVEDAEPIPV